MDALLTPAGRLVCTQHVAGAYKAVAPHPRCPPSPLSMAATGVKVRYVLGVRVGNGPFQVPGTPLYDGVQTVLRYVDKNHFVDESIPPVSIGNESTLQCRQEFEAQGHFTWTLSLTEGDSAEEKPVQLMWQKYVKCGDIHEFLEDEGSHKWVEYVIKASDGSSFGMNTSLGSALQALLTRLEVCSSQDAANESEAIDEGRDLICKQSPKDHYRWVLSEENKHSGQSSELGVTWKAQRSTDIHAFLTDDAQLSLARRGRKRPRS